MKAILAGFLVFWMHIGFHFGPNIDIFGHLFLIEFWIPVFMVSGRILEVILEVFLMPKRLRNRSVEHPKKQCFTLGNHRF